jgi:metal-responsive CopG/Arc/MetJ family transcriptional regulator
MKERPKTQLVSLQIAPTLLEIVDKFAERRFTTRSEFIRQAVLAEIEKLCSLIAA